MSFYNWLAANKRNVVIAALYVVFMVLFGVVGIPAKHVVGFIAGLLLTGFYAVAVWFVWVKILGKSF